LQKSSGAGCLRRCFTFIKYRKLPAVAAPSSPSARSATVAIAAAESAAAWTSSATLTAATSSAARSAAIARLVYLDAASFEVSLVQRLNRLRGAVLIRHLDEPESA
jgi:hypothetical protein